MFQVNGLNSCDPLPIINDFSKIRMKSARLNKSIKNNIAIEINNGNSSKLLSFVS